MSISLKLVCNCNFKKQSDIDDSVFKIFKMFSEHMVKKSSPIHKDSSDISCVYRYEKLTADHLRMFKKLADSNKASIYLKEIIVDGEKGKKKNDTEEDSGSESDKGKKGKEKDSGSESDNGKDSGSESDNGKDSGSESDNEKDSGSDSDSDSDVSISSSINDKGDGMMSAMDSIKNHVTSLLTEIEDLKEKIRTTK